MINSIRVFPGVAGIKAAYEETLHAMHLDIQCLSKGYETIIGTYFDTDYSPRLFKSTIMTREILSDTKENREYGEKKDGKKNLVGFLPGAESESDVIITDISVVFISYTKDNPYAVVTEDKEIRNTLQAQFNRVWESIQ